MIKYLIVFGMRSEVIKVISLMKELQKDSKICRTLRSREIFNKILCFFEMILDFICVHGNTTTERLSKTTF